MMRNQRQDAILKIIDEREIETQEELCDALAEQNIMVTQATISRDIKDLKLFKIVGNKKKYRYSHVTKSVSNVSDRMRSLFKESVLSIKSAGNLIVIRTIEGNGGNAGAIVDSMKLDCILGCVAGDDTVFVAVDNIKSVQSVVDILKNLMV